ncbi:hypothetical protein NC997_16935 [Trichocoleus sp. DQ-A2]|nr:hypothetical protein [Coleofasciculus sp. FACHB-T130]
MSQLGNNLTGFCLVTDFVVNQEITDESAAKRRDRVASPKENRSVLDKWGCDRSLYASIIKSGNKYQLSASIKKNLLAGCSSIWVVWQFYEDFVKFSTANGIPISNTCSKLRM